MYFPLMQTTALTTIYHITDAVRTARGMQGTLLGVCRAGARPTGHILTALTKIGTGYYLYRFGDGSSEFIHAGKSEVDQLIDQNSDQA